MAFDLGPMDALCEVHKLSEIRGNVLHVCAYERISKERSSHFHQSLREGP